jgi:amino acid permease
VEFVHGSAKVLCLFILIMVYLIMKLEDGTIKHQVIGQLVHNALEIMWKEKDVT